MAEEELMVVLRKSEDATFGFSLLRTDSLIGFPHVIYDIVENSPAAECGEVSTYPARAGWSEEGRAVLSCLVLLPTGWLYMLQNYKQGV